MNSDVCRSDQTVFKVQSKMENATLTGSSTDLPMHLVKDSLYIKL